MSDQSIESLPTNRLIDEPSPYLLQHARNPVDWYPWGEEAFERARREGKLILVSIGYSTCHWCHVMAHESFEDEEVADALLADYIAIKVDREERPDIDQLYMEVCTRLTGQGGWPLNVLLTPDRLPFFAGTYIPKHDRGGRLGLMNLLPKAAQLWREEPQKLRDAGESLLKQLGSLESAGASGAELDPSLFEGAAEQLKEQFDPHHGGFGKAPKFPRPHDLRFLLQRHLATGDETCLAMVEKTLTHIACGGVWDHLGFGVHRYSTDERWLLPHFEKMLYDQAGLCLAALEAWQITSEPDQARLAMEILAYVEREMRDTAGGFYCAQDADTEGVEGKFYIWRHEEIFDVLGQKEGERFARLYNVRPGGNFEPEVPGEEVTENILHLSAPLSEADRQATEEARKKLFAHRALRTPPHKDDKILTAWSGFMVSAFATAARVLDEPRYLDIANEGGDFLWETMRPGEGALLRRYRNGKAGIGAFSEDYAFFAQGLLDLYRADFDPRHLHRAVVLAAELVERFLDEKTGYLYDTPKDGEDLGLRPRSTFDGAHPSPNAIALGVFARLWHLTGEPLWEEIATAVASGLVDQLRRYPGGYCALLHSAALLLEETTGLVITGSPEHSETRAMLDLVRRRERPGMSVLLRTPRSAAQLDQIAPWTRSMDASKPAAYLCDRGSCRQPVSTAAALETALG